MLEFAERTLSYYKLKDARSMFDEVRPHRPPAASLGRRHTEADAHTRPLQMDADNSGRLDADEVATLCKQMGKKLNDKGLQAAMADMDEDGSGEVRQDAPATRPPAAPDLRAAAVPRRN